MTREQAVQHFQRSAQFTDEGTVTAMLKAMGFVSPPPQPDVDLGDRRGWSRAKLAEWMRTATRSRVINHTEHRQGQQ